MSLTSSTGLLASVKQNIRRKKEDKTHLVFNNISGPAPYALRPFAGLFNPFPYGCSILCNHPADFEAKDVVRRAKETWANEGKPILLPEELNALRANALMCRQIQQQEDGDEMVPEELFRRYTETDSRPLTPAPTLASGMTHGSNAKGGRRCFTPDPVPSHPTNERPLLVLDLRRTQSQETISWHGGPGGPLPTTILQPPTRSPTPSSGTGGAMNRRGRKATLMKKPSTEVKSEEDHDTDGGNKLQQNVMKTLPPPIPITETLIDKKEEEEIQRRRGRQRKKNKKHSRDLSSALENEFTGLIEPGETQISAFGNESQSGSARPSLSVAGIDGLLSPFSRASFSARGSEANAHFGSSYLDTDVLKLLSRELDREIIDNEFNTKRRLVLEEAMKMFPPECRPPPSEEMNKLKKELSLPPTDTELWLSLPRTFSRQSARFELPLDMEAFKKMTPMEYIRSHVHITSGRRMLYNLVFNRHKEDVEDENIERTLKGERLILAIGEMMGRPMSEEEGNKFQGLVGWQDEDYLDFRTWCGLCALCERILGPEFSSQTLSHEQDPRHEIEKADFDTLPRKLCKVNENVKLVTILKLIRDL